MSHSSSPDCPLCDRPLGGSTSRHHLIPRSQGGRKGETAELHLICHDKIHSLFWPHELRHQLNTFEKLREQEQILVFIDWIRDKPPDFYERTKNERRKRRRRR